MAAMFGSVGHDIIETALIDLKYLAKVSKGTCLSCGLSQPDQCHEHGAVDLETKSRGHMDGILVIGGKTRGFEFKTAMPRALDKIMSNDLETFRKKWPYYYAQAQEYMRMTGLAVYKVVFLAMGTPWDMREFTIHADPFFQEQTRQKYLMARAAVADGILPPPCCGIGSAQAKSCPAMGCPVKRFA
jgi:hypothetical protein